MYTYSTWFRAEGCSSSRLISPGEQESYLPIFFALKMQISIFFLLYMITWYFQNYFDDLAKYLRVGPPLYFVVKDFNYRYCMVLFFMFLRSAKFEMFVLNVLFPAWSQGIQTKYVQSANVIHILS